jgi:hypothetical protein
MLSADLCPLSQITPQHFVAVPSGCTEDVTGVSRARVCILCHLNRRANSCM